MKDVKVLVSSCACNQKFLTLVEKVVKENGIDAKVSAVSDIMEPDQRRRPHGSDRPGPEPVPHGG